MSGSPFAADFLSSMICPVGANTVYVTKDSGSTVMLRSELRVDHSWDRQSYDNGTESSQLLFNLNLIYNF